MNGQRSPEYLEGLAEAMCFALVGKAAAYLVWGVRDQDHAVVGSNFDVAHF